jgi:single-strand DNA-binding protein
MAYGLNKVQLIGRLGADPELRFTDNNVAVCRMRIATNESYKDQSGQLVDRVEWHTVVAWRRVAEILGEHLKKGAQVYIEGKLQTREYDDKEGNKRWSTEVVVNDFMFLDSKSDRGSGGGYDQGGSGSGSAGASTGGGQQGGSGGDEGDLPF